MTSFYSDILPRLQKDKYFENFKFIKKNVSFRQKTEFGFYQVELYLHVNSYDLNRQAEALQIRPIYGVRFDILSKWFEKFSFKSLSDQRSNPTTFVDGKMLNHEDEFYFLTSKKYFEDDYSNFKDQLTFLCSNYFEKYKSVNDYYKIHVLPILNKKCKMNDVGADWIFEYLTAVKLCEFEKFDEMVEMLRRQIYFMNSRNEPNVALYNNKFDYIFQYLRDSSLN